MKTSFADGGIVVIKYSDIIMRKWNWMIDF